MEQRRLEIIYLPANKLKHVDGNPRKKKDPLALEKLRTLIEEHGFQNPLQVYKEKAGYTILCGNHRFDAGTELGMTEFPCIIYEGAKQMAMARAISDNKSNEWTEWDMPGLKAWLTEIDDGSIKLEEATGFEFKELEDILAGCAGDGEVKEDDFDAEAEAEKIEEPISKPGDIWILGRHRLLCGDATAHDDIAKLMAGHSADLVWTAPPYGVSYTDKNDFLNKAQTGIGHKAIAGDCIKEDDPQTMLQDAFRNMADHTKDGGCVYVAHADINSAFFRQAMEAAGIYVSQSLIWVKNSAVLSRNDYNWKHETILYGWKEGAAHYFGQDFTQTTVIDDEADLPKMSKEALVVYAGELRQMVPTTIFREDRPTRNDLHPTMKPIGLVARMIKNSSKAGENVLDVFGGSGTTLMAAEQTGRNAFLSELDAKYVDVIKLRWEQFTGKTARKEA